jgi:hypothetical protein
MYKFIIDGAPDQTDSLTVQRRKAKASQPEAKQHASEQKPRPQQSAIVEAQTLTDQIGKASGKVEGGGRGTVVERQGEGR